MCLDNAQQESYWASLKVEFYNRQPWPTRAEAMTAVADWTERVYNRRRRHSSLNMLTPVVADTRATGIRVGTAGTLEPDFPPWGNSGTGAGTDQLDRCHCL